MKRLWLGIRYYFRPRYYCTAVDIQKSPLASEAWFWTEFSARCWCLEYGGHYIDRWK